jgi:hypothetical protein
LGDEKVGVDRNLLTQVMGDAREANQQGERAYGETHQRIVLRNRELFPLYSELTNGRRLVAYFAKIEDPKSAMEPADIAPMAALLEREGEIENLDLLISSPGGSAQTAEKIVAICRGVCRGEFRVVVPNMAKSAATMVALCADQIVMGHVSELGPIDPQVPVRVGDVLRFVSAQSFIDGREALLREIDEALKRGASVAPYLQLLSSPDMSQAWITEMERRTSFGKDVVRSHLRDHMLPRLMRGSEPRSIGRRASQIATNVSQANLRFSHDRMIGPKECRDDLGLDVEILPREDERWRVIWEIWLRMEIFLQTYSKREEGPAPVKIFADSDAVALTG